MNRLGILLGILLLGAIAQTAAAQQPATLDQVEDRIVSQEQVEAQSLRAFAPLVETYIQTMAPDEEHGSVPAGDKYFLGRVQLAKGVEFEPLVGGEAGKRRLARAFDTIFSPEFLPRGFLQMIYVDENDFDKKNYHFDFVRREFLGEIRCFVFDVTPLQKAGRGRFLGRIWVEDQGFHIVRFNGAFLGSGKGTRRFHFDSWRVNATPNLWVPAFIYSEESDVRGTQSKTLMYKAQTLLWGYNLGRASQEEEFNKQLAAAPGNDAGAASSVGAAQGTLDAQIEDGVTARMARMGLLAPSGEVDKILETVVNNLEVTNNLNVDIRCRVLMTTTLESFSIGHTIVLSRGLIDVLPDEASLAAVLAHELSHIILGHPTDKQFAVFDQLLFDDKDTFRHFGFPYTPAQEEAANEKGVELMERSPYKAQLEGPRLFMAALQKRANDIPNLASPHLKASILVSASGSAPATARPAGSGASGNAVIVALPLGGRIKLNPWNDELTMLKAQPVAQVAQSETMPFEVAPFVLYLTRASK